MWPADPKTGEADVQLGPETVTHGPQSPFQQLRQPDRAVLAPTNGERVQQRGQGVRISESARTSGVSLNPQTPPLRTAPAYGTTETDVIRATIEIPDAAITIPNAPFCENDRALSGALEARLHMPFTGRFSMRFTAGVNYIEDLSDDESAIAGPDLAAISTSSRVSVPLSITGRWDFRATIAFFSWQVERMFQRMPPVPPT